MLRFSRGKAYEVAREFLATASASGMPVIRLGRQLRVPRALFEQWIGGPITWPLPIERRAPAAPANPTGSQRQTSAQRRE